jgi:uncharacterized damage-inducible protein DinB
LNEALRISDELKRSLTGPAWHGPALSELLAGVTAEQAAERPITAAHTIHELVLHIIAWAEVARGVLRGEPAPDLPFGEDWPTQDGREWDRTIELLIATMGNLVQAAGSLSDEDLGRRVAGRDYSVYVLLHGIAQHNAYHGGQIALLSKAGQPRTS